MDIIEILGRLSEGKIELEEASKLVCKRNAVSEEEMKILKMVRDKKVSPVEGKELLEALFNKVSSDVKQTSVISTKPVVRFGIATIILGIIFLVVVPVLFYTAFICREPGNMFTKAELEMMDKEGYRQVFSDGERSIRKDNPDGSSTIYMADNPFTADFFIWTVFLISIALPMIIYGIGIIKLKEWARKMAIVVSIFTIFGSFVFLVLSLIILYI